MSRLIGRPLYVLLAATLLISRAEGTQLDADTVSRLTSLEVMRGPTIDPGGLRDKAVVVAFFASWCVPCRAGFAELRQVLDEAGTDNVAVVAVNWLEDAGHYPGESFRLQRLLDRVAPHITVVVGDRATSAAFGDVEALPTLFVFGSDGLERFRFEYDGVSPPSHPTHAELLDAIATQR